MEILTMKEVKERLLQSDLGSATDSFNYILVLRKVKNTNFRQSSYNSYFYPSSKTKRIKKRFFRF